MLHSLSKIQNESCVVLLIAPFWARQLWFQTLLSLLIATPMLLPSQPYLLRMLGSKARFHNVGHLSLTAIKQHYIQMGFSQESADLAARGRRESTLQVYSVWFGGIT